ncbi:MAG: hypothetical protein JO075_05140 [Acidimicrobiia bacterium]|nr:hypothetical protein [Acidimicrobiia bacterium]
MTRSPRAPALRQADKRRAIPLGKYKKAANVPGGHVIRPIQLEGLSRA